MGKFYHKLKANRRMQMPVNLIFYDTETNPIKQFNGTIRHELKLGVACYLRRAYGRHKQKEKWLHFTEIHEFWDWVESFTRNKTKFYIIAHNQQFDAFVVDMFRELPKRGWEMKRPFIDSNIFIVRFTKGSKTLMCLDSLNWFKFSLKQLGEYVGIPKLKINFKTCTDVHLDEYCTSDVQIVKETLLKWIKFIKTNNLGCFQKTLASQAFTAFRHKYMKHNIMIHAHAAATKLERAAYRGGRNEAFQLGLIKEMVTLLDFNSLYPAMMKNNVYPTKMIKHVKYPTMRGLRKDLRNKIVIAKVNITIAKPAIAVRANRLIFPIGTFDAVLTSPELKYVLEHGSIHKVYEYVVYNYAKIFEDYVSELYPLRLQYKKNNDLIGNFMTKLFLNTLYGKFGQRVQTHELIGDADINDVSVERVIIYETNEKYRIKTFAGKRYRVYRGNKESRNSFPAIAAFVSAYARMKLWRAITIAGQENVFYVDTDSLFVNDKGLKNLNEIICIDKLGALKVECSGRDLFIHGLKDYFFMGKTKIKGIKKDAVKIELNTYKQSRFLKFRSSLIKGSLDAPIEDYVIKHLKRKYLKGNVSLEGNVTPFILPEDYSLVFPPKKKCKGRDLPTVDQIYDKALALYMQDNLVISQNVPELEELKEEGYIRTAQLELMRTQ